MMDPVIKGPFSSETHRHFSRRFRRSAGVAIFVAVVSAGVLETAAAMTMDHGEKCARECLRTKSANFCIQRLNAWSDSMAKLQKDEDFRRFLAQFAEICPKQKKVFLKEFPEFRDFEK